MLHTVLQPCIFILSRLAICSSLIDTEYSSPYYSIYRISGYTRCTCKHVSLGPGDMLVSQFRRMSVIMDGHGGIVYRWLWISPVLSLCAIKQPTKITKYLLLIFLPRSIPSGIFTSSAFLDSRVYIYVYILSSPKLM